MPPRSVTQSIRQAPGGQETVTESAKTSRPSAPDDAATAQKLGGLTTAAGQALGELKALFADGAARPTMPTRPPRRRRSQRFRRSSISPQPEGTNPITTAAIDKVSAGAAKALSIIQALPETIADAAAAIARAEAALTGAPVRGPRRKPDRGQCAATVPAGPKLPTFDVLRVEPDGSTVIAGSAEPNSKLEILDRDTVLMGTDVGDNGDFVAVLENPLSSGDHQLQLRATAKDGKVTTSEEIATISIPKDGNASQLLAMVSARRCQPHHHRSRCDATDTRAAPPRPTRPRQRRRYRLPRHQTRRPSDDSGGRRRRPGQCRRDRGRQDSAAGTAKPQSNVFGYADDKLIGKAKAGPDGHFVIDGVMPLAVGDHKIRSSSSMPPVFCLRFRELQPPRRQPGHGGGPVRHARRQCDRADAVY